MKPYIYLPVHNSQEEILIDRSAYDSLRLHRIWINEEGYAYNENGLIHRQILGFKKNDGNITDHINRDKLDNRKVNLRNCTAKENTLNSMSDYRKKYKGASMDGDMFKSSITINGKNIFLGRWVEEKQAAMAYDKASRFFYPGKVVFLNFPYKTTYKIKVPNIDYKPCRKWADFI